MATGMSDPHDVAFVLGAYADLLIEAVKRIRELEQELEKADAAGRLLLEALIPLTSLRQP